MVNGNPRGIFTPRDKIKIGNRVRRDDGQLAAEVKGHKVDQFDTITPVEICHQVFGDGQYYIFKKCKQGLMVVQQDVPSFRQTQDS